MSPTAPPERMRLQIVVAPQSSLALSNGALSSAADALAATPRNHADRRRLAREVLDVFMDSANVTARVQETHGAFVLRDLAVALVDLAWRRRGKATIRFYDEPWELCVERFGKTACLSVYRAGPDPLIVVYDCPVPFDDVVAAAREAIEQLLSGGKTAAGTRLELASAAEQLATVVPTTPGDDAPVPEPLAVVIGPDRDCPVSFAAEFVLRDAAPFARSSSLRSLAGTACETDACDAVERSDLHALLFRGRVRAEVRGRVVDLGECHPVLLAERLVEIARRAFDAWERGLTLNARGEAAGVVVGARVSPDGEVALTLGPSSGVSRRAVHTFPALGVADVLEGALAFGRSLVRAVLRRDRSQSTNLRLSALRRALRESTETLRHAHQTQSKVNPSPEPYRAFAAALDEARPAAPQRVPATRLRYAARWRAIVPGIDLRATYLCGDRLIVGASTEMWALDRSTGSVLWRSDVVRGTSVVTPTGVARLSSDGTLCVYDFVSGERTLRGRIAPRVGGTVAGAVVHLPGLPRLVVVTEGEHHLVAIDLTTGEPRWRWSWGAGRGSSRGAPRIKRAGRLIYFTCGDGALTALDVMTGAVVWRLRDRLRFRTVPAVGHDALFVVSGGAHGVARLYCVDPFSGDVRWSAPLGEPQSPCSVEGAPLVTSGAVAVALRQKAGLALAVFGREDGTPMPRRTRAVAPAGTSWLAVDDAFIGNAPTGELVAVDARTGDLAWRHVLGPRPLEADVPRRLEPVLRCGALFVPCSLVTVPSPKRAPGWDSSFVESQQGAMDEPSKRANAGICILRPADGALVGTIAPSEAIPDLLRVDEHCNVYVAEESGHIAAFGALPRLSIVPAGGRTKG